MSAEYWLESQLSVHFGRFGRGGARGSSLAFPVSSRARRIAIMGPSGSGKSTFLKILAGVERRATGFLRVGGESWQDSASGFFKPSPDRRVGWVPQSALLFPHLSVGENLLFSKNAASADWRGIASALRIEDLLKRRPRNLSGGESQRVAVGRALLSRPKLLLLDEPFAALNESLRADVLAFIAKHCAESGISLLLATHRRSEALALCEDVLDWDFDETYRPRKEDLTALAPCSPLFGRPRA